MTDDRRSLNVVLIDDEERSRLILKKLIEEYINDVTVVAMADDVLEGVKVIQQHQPDIVFLDIEMPGYSGFKLVEYFDEVNFEIVFTTAYEKYAVKAYKTSAIGYLLKPIDIEELIKIFEKITQKFKDKPFGTRHLLADLPQRVIFPTQSGLIYLDTDEICHLESAARYTDIYLIDNQKMTATLSLKDCFIKLQYSTFIQIHRSFVINLAHIQNYSKGRDSYVIMDNDKKVDVGLFYKENLNKAISSFLK